MTKEFVMDDVSFDFEPDEGGGEAADEFDPSTLVPDFEQRDAQMLEAMEGVLDRYLPTAPAAPQADPPVFDLEAEVDVAETLSAVADHLVEGGVPAGRLQETIDLAREILAASAPTFGENDTVAWAALDAARTRVVQEEELARVTDDFSKTLGEKVDVVETFKLARTYFQDGVKAGQYATDDEGAAARAMWRAANEIAFPGRDGDERDIGRAYSNAARVNAQKPAAPSAATTPPDDLQKRIAAAVARA